MMTPFSFMLLGLILYLFIRSKSIIKIYIAFIGLTVALEINNLAGFCFIIGGREISYFDVILIITTTLSVIVLVQKARIRKSAFVISALLTCSILFGMVLCIVFPPNAEIIPYGLSYEKLLYGLTLKTVPQITFQSYLMFFRFICFLLIALTIISIKPKNEEIVEMVSSTLILTKIQICYSIVEIITKNILHSNIMTEIRNVVLGIGSSTVIGSLSRGTSSAIMGLTREPSLLATTLCLFIMMCILLRIVEKEKFWILVALLTMLFSMSFSSLYYLVCICILYVFVYKIRIRAKTIIIVLFGSLAVAIGIWFFLSKNQYYLERVRGLINDLSVMASGMAIGTGNVTSSLVRFYSFTDAFLAYLHRPLLGLGIGTSNCYSGVVVTLSNIGIVGFLLWLKFLFCECSSQKNRFFSKRSKYLIIAILVPNLFNGSLEMLYAIYNVLFAFALDNLGTDTCEKVAKSKFSSNSY